jgi:excisionase family DNA binding protein
MSFMDYRDPDWVADKLGLEKNTVYKFLQDGTIPAIQLGRKWLISESALERWLCEEAEKQTQARREAASSAEKTVRRMDNFSPHAREVIRAAHSEARRYSHHYLGQEHLLLGFAAVRDCTASQMLVARGIPLEQFRSAFESRVAAGDSPPPRRLGRTPRMKKAMRLAMKEATRDGAKLVGSEHLLLGLLLAGEGLGYEILTHAGLAVESLRDAIGVIINRGKPEVRKP